MINLHLVEEAILAYVPIHLWDVVGQVRQGMELNETFFMVFLGPDLMGMGDGGTPDAALGLLHFLEAEALLVLLLLLLLFLAASAASLLSRISIHPLLCMW